MKHLLKKTLCVCVALACGCLMLIAATDYMKYVQWGDDAIAKQKWDDAITYLEEAMRIEPSNPQNVLLLSNVAMLHHYAGEDSLALDKLTHARAMAPGSVVILNNRARVLSAMGRNEDAMADYRLILSMDSTYADAYYDLGALELQQGDVKGAEANALRYMSLVTPTDSVATKSSASPTPAQLQGELLLAVIYSNTRRPEEAIRMYNDIIKAQPEAVYYSARAMCRLQLEHLPEAADDIARGLELDPNDGELYFCRAFLNKLRFREEDAREDARKALELGVDPRRVHAVFSMK